MKLTVFYEAVDRGPVCMGTLGNPITWSPEEPPSFWERLAREETDQGLGIRGAWRKPPKWADKVNIPLLWLGRTEFRSYLNGIVPLLPGERKDPALYALYVFHWNDLKPEFTFGVALYEYHLHRKNGPAPFPDAPLEV